MAFPAGYTKYQEVTIDNTKVGSDETDFPVLVDLSTLSLAGADIFDTCRTDGGDIRITKTDGTTELPREVVSIDTTGKTGELHFKFTGTLSSSVDTVVRVWYNGTDTEPATSATYGRDNVWTNYRAVYHFQDDPASGGTLTDSTGNGNDMTSQGSMVSGDLVGGLFAGDAGAWDFAAGTQYAKGSAGELQHEANEAQSWSGWFEKSNASGYWFFMHRDAETNNQGKFDATGGDQNLHLRDSGTAQLNVRYSTAMATAAVHHMAFSYAGDAVAANCVATVDGADDTLSTTADTLGTGDDITTATQSPQINARATLASEHAIKFGEWRQSASEIPQSYFITEYKNQNSPSTFYSVGAEQTSGTDYPLTTVVGAFTLTGVATNLNIGKLFTTAVGAFTLTGIATTFLYGKTLVTSVGAFTLTGTATLLSAGKTLTTAVGAFTLTGIATTFTYLRGIVATVASFVLTGVTTTLSKTGTTWTSQSKSTSTWTDQTKSSSTWTPQNKS